MANSSRVHRLWNALVVLALAVSAGAVSSSQTITSLASLTVPQDRLPTGCRMKPITPPDKTATQVGAARVTGPVPPFAAFPYPSNPWYGTATRLLVETRKKIDKSPSYFFDAPPDKANATEQDWVQHVVEAYHAVYDLTNNSPLEVSAVKFDDPKLALPNVSVTSQMLSPSGVDNRIVKGDVVVKLAGDPTTDCFKVIDAYIRGTR